ncbi:MAG: ATP-dependent RNA helicase [Bdellovibrionaceae bacterium]|nr:ATP-dependent RNA helicase [Pseudobdellovibrionaceae bacterium]
MLYNDFGIHSDLKANIAGLGYTEATPIQDLVLPHAIEGKDISGLAQTGTGKTAAFLIPLIHRIFVSRDENAPEEFKKHAFKNWSDSSFVLCLVPTRELAQQVADQAAKLSANQKLNVVSAVGGEDINIQTKQIKESPLDILIATPGRLIDLYKSHHIDLKQVVAVVFDEADRMFDMGFQDDMKYILRRLPDDRQYLLFSATMNLDVLTISYQFGAEPVECHLRSEKLKADNVQDEVFHVGQDEKAQVLLSLIKKEDAKQVIIFTNLKRLVQPIATFLQKNGFEALGISSLLNQRQRNRVLEHFKTEGKANILVATDVAARGLDVQGVDLVVNFDLPDDAENYVHRIGRTGRAGAKGKAFSLSSDRDVEALSRIQEYIGHKVEIGWLEDADMAKDFVAFDPRPKDEFFSERKRAVDRKKRDMKKGRNNKKRPGGNQQNRNAKKSSNPEERNQQQRSDKPKSSKPNPNRSKSNNKKRSTKKSSSKAKSASKGKLKVSSKNRKPSSKAQSAPKKENLTSKITGVFKKLFS